MLRRLRGSSASPAANAAAVDGRANADMAGAVWTATAVAALTPATAAKPPTLDEKAAMLTDALGEIVPGILQPFSRQELARIKKRFVGLQRDDDSSCMIAACASLPELAGAPFARLVMQLIASWKAEGVRGESPRASPRPSGRIVPDRISFDGFLTTLSILSVKQRVAVKRQVLFRVYDTDGDGVVSVDDFVATLLATTSALPRAELKASIAAHFKLWTAHSEEPLLNSESFQALFSDADVHTALTIAF